MGVERRTNTEVAPPEGLPLPLVAWGSAHRSSASIPLKQGPNNLCRPLRLPGYMISTVLDSRDPIHKTCTSLVWEYCLEGLLGRFPVRAPTSQPPTV